MTARMRGADLLAQTLARHEADYIFTVSGNHVMPIFDAASGAGLKLIHTRHEAAAVYMADAWGRLTGRPGIALVTGGPGHANALSALFSAKLAESPVVLLSGHAPRKQLGSGAFQEMQQAEMAVPVTKASWTASSALALASDIGRAIGLALSGRRGPVHLSLPMDVLNCEIAADGPINPEDYTLSRLSDVEAQAVMNRLTSAARPLILVGPMGLTREGQAHVRTLEDASGIPVVAMESPRGIDDPSLGRFASLLRRADLVLLLGKRVDYTIHFGSSPPFAPTCEFIQIDSELSELERSSCVLHERLTGKYVADLNLTCDDLSAIAEKPIRNRRCWLDEVRSAIRYRPPKWSHVTSGVSRKLHPVEACRPLQAVLDGHPDSILVCDGGEFGQWAQANLNSPRRVINGPAGAIGAALPMAIAARLAAPEVPILAMTGDGSFGFHIAEIDTAVRYDLPVVAVVGNDARWNAEYQIQLKQYGADRAAGCELLPTRYDLVASAFGGHGEYIDTAEALGPAVHRALTSNLPSCLNVAIDGRPAPIFDVPT